jgi:D-beta-D-heptose 7-phosphate kinase/D-beta-D-heptose 1-phosphate adenosyltransferase
MSNNILERLQSLVVAFQGKSVVGIGDVMLDQYRRGSTIFINPEAPTLDLLNPDLTETPGGAANVACNIGHMGGNVKIIGVVGKDKEAESLQKLFSNQNGVQILAVEDSSRPTTLKLRFCHDQYQVLRVSQESRESIAPEISEQCKKEITEALKQSKVLFVEDYGKGVVRENIVDFFVELLANNPDLEILFDPRIGNEAVYKKGMCTVLKPNWKEACHLAQVDYLKADPESVARKLSERYATSVALTMGPKGVFVFDLKTNRATLVPTRAHEAFDVAGAGDTAIASMALAMAAGATLVEAAHLANIASGIVVKKSGTAYATSEEICHEMTHDETQEILRKFAEKN